MATRPRVIAHRGASAQLAEHTLAAYRLAIEQGADGLECDVRLTRDGVPILVHDRTLARTSSGRGSVSAMRLSDLEELDFASWRQRTEAEGLAALRDRGTEAITAWRERAVRDNEGEPPPVPLDPDRTSVVTLEALLDLVEAAERPLELAIETKHPTRYGGLVEATIGYLLTQRGLIDSKHSVRIMSFAPTSLRRVKAIDPRLQTVMLFKRPSLRLRDGALPAYADVAGPSLAAVRAAPDWVARAHDQGHQVHVWTVDEPADVAFITATGADAIITNRPQETLAQLES